MLGGELLLVMNARKSTRVHVCNLKHHVSLASFKGEARRRKEVLGVSGLKVGLQLLLKLICTVLIYDDLKVISTANNALIQGIRKIFDEALLETQPRVLIQGRLVCAERDHEDIELRQIPDELKSPAIVRSDRTRLHLP